MTDREMWRERWLRSINELTSLDIQKEYWLDKKNTTNPHWSFIEFFSCYFDDLGINDNYNEVLRIEWVSKKEFEIIQNWNEVLKEYKSPNNDDYDNEAIVNDAKWQDIINIGIIAKNKLIQILNHQEKNFLNE